MGNAQNQNRFRPVQEEELSKVVDILEKRLPKSSNVYNMVKVFPVLKPKVVVFSLDYGTISKDSIILVNAHREDFDQEIGISAPGDYFDQANLRDALTEIEKRAVDWTKSYSFDFVEGPAAAIVVEVSTRHKGNLTHCNPCNAYGVDKTDEFLNENIYNGSVVLKNIDMNEGLNLILNGWKSSTKRTEEYLRRILKVLPSTGLYSDGKIRSGAVQNTHGVIGKLCTLPEETDKGYGVKVMRQLIQEIKADGLTPCSVATKSNLVSQKFHEKVGMHKSHDVYYIWYTKN